MVSNYKSLRQIVWQPGPLTVVIGANASGKSNLADFHDFLADLYRHGLAVAVARKGGYENIAHRKMRRSRRAISVEISAEITSSDRDSWPVVYRRFLPDLRFTHSFSFRAEGRAIRSDFRIQEELVRLERKTDRGWQILTEIRRADDKFHHRSVLDDLKHMAAGEQLYQMFRY
jgi:predicted ATPase